jgi:type II secretory pathway component GspD/PulD (secretin)
MEMQVQLSKLKKLFEKIAECELEVATVVFADPEDEKRSGPLLFQKQKMLDNLKAEAKATREQLDKLVAKLPQGYPLQLTSSVDQSVSPDQAAQKLHSHSRKNSASAQETAPEVLAVKVEFTKAKLITELLWGVLKTEGNHSVGADERANRIVLRGEKQWIENTRKLIETLDRCGSPNLKAAESR